MSDIAIMSIKLASGAFEASVSIPLKDDMTEADFSDSIARWLALSMTALQHGITEMKATLPSPAQEEGKRRT